MRHRRTLEENLVILSDYPDNERLRETCVRQFLEHEDPSKALSLLNQVWYVLNEHEPGPLPCLCRGCVAHSEQTADLQGQPMVRDFARWKRRVLFYWLPEDLLSEKTHVRRSVSAELAHTIQTKKPKR
jgi:hypothetical protein